MAFQPRSTVPRRTASNGAVPAYLRPGEIFTVLDATGQPAAYIGDGNGTPIPFGGGGGAVQPGILPTAKPNNPTNGQTWLDLSGPVAQYMFWNAANAAWERVFNDAHLLMRDGSRTLTGPIDGGGNALTNMGDISATATGASINDFTVDGGRF